MKASLLMRVLKMPVRVGQGIGKRTEMGLLDPIGVGHPGTHAAVMPAKGDVLCPGVVLLLQIGDVSGVSEWQERSLQIAHRALHLPLGLWPAWRQDDGPGAKHTEEGGHLLVEPGALPGNMDHHGGVIV